MEETTAPLSRTAIDRILQTHFEQEAQGDVAGTLLTFTDDVVHDVVGDPAGELHGRAAAGERYTHLFASARGEGVQVLHRLYGDDFAVDDKIWTARVVGEFLGMPGNGKCISFRVLHVFEFRDGLISRENVWIDAAAAIAQLGAP